MTMEYGSRKAVAILLIRSGERALDVGCHDGVFGKLLLKRGYFSEVYGVDLDEPCLQIARENGLVATRLDLNDGRLPYPDCYFDTVTCLDVMEHLIYPLSVLKEIHRVLKENGNVIVSTPNVGCGYHVIRLLLGKPLRTSFGEDREDWNQPDGGHLHYYTFFDLRRTLNHACFVRLQERATYNTRSKFISASLRILARTVLRSFFCPGIVMVARKSNSVSLRP